MSIVIVFFNIALVALLQPTDAGNTETPLFLASSPKATSATKFLQCMFNYEGVAGTNDFEWFKKNVNIQAEQLQGLFKLFAECANDQIISEEGSVKFLAEVIHYPAYSTPFFELFLAPYYIDDDGMSKETFSNTTMGKFCCFEVLSDGDDKIRVKSMERGFKAKGAEFFNATFMPAESIPA